MSKAMIAIAATIASLALAPAARAGSYDVYACGGPAGAAQNAFNAAADTLMSAYSICPSSGYVGTGIVTKSTSSGGTARHLAGAYQVFDAPPGTTLDRVTFQVGALRFASYWTVGIVAYDDDFNVGHLPYGCYAGGPGCDLGANVFYGPVTVPLYGHRHFRIESRCGSTSGCDVSYSGGVPGNRALFSMTNVTVRVIDNLVPAVEPRYGALWQGGWHGGREEAWSYYTDNVGVMVTRLLVDGQLRAEQDYRDGRWPAGVRCDFTYRRPCHDITPGGLAFDTTEVPDGDHIVRVEAIDAAGNSAGHQRTITVDNGAPARPTAISVHGGEGWRRDNGFDVSWTLPQGQVSPLTRVHYRLCGSGGCDSAQRAGSIDHLEGLTVPAAGDYTLRVWLEDAAGNTNSEHASDAVHLRFDDRAPQGYFESLDADDPLQLRARLTDHDSGIGSASIEIRRLGGQQWHGFDTSVAGPHASARIDDLDLPDGAYEVRALVVDGAGNDAIVSRLADGVPLRIRLPLRASVKVGVAAGAQRRPTRCRRVRGKRRCRRPAATTVTPDGRAELRGRVEVAGQPLADATLSVVERTRAGAAIRGATVRSDSGGAFSYRSTAAPSRSVSFAYDGSKLIKPARGRFELRVPARTSISVRPRRLGNGRSVRFRGRLGGGFVPPAGKLVALEAHFRGRWRTFATPTTDRHGNWGYRYRFGATVGSVLYRFRVRIPFETAYPFESAYSRTVRVRVTG